MGISRRPCGGWSTTINWSTSKTAAVQSSCLSAFVTGLLIAALFGMHRFLLPQLLASGMIDEGHWGIRAITWAPAVLILFLLLSVLLL